MGGDVLGDLVDCNGGVDTIPCQRRDVKDGHLLLEGVAVEMENLGIRARAALGGDPGNIDIDEEDDIGGTDGVIHRKAQTQPCRV